MPGPRFPPVPWVGVLPGPASPGGRPCGPGGTPGPERRVSRELPSPEPRRRGRGPSGTGLAPGAPPALAVARVLDEDAGRRELVPEPVRRGPVAGRPGRDPGIEEGDLLGGELLGRVRQDAKHQVQVAQRRQRASGVGPRQGALRQAPVEVADQVEDGAQGRGDRQVVVEGRPERTARRAQHLGHGRVVGAVRAVRLERGHERVQAVDGGGRGGERLVAEVEAGPVVSRQQGVAKRPRRDPVLEKIGDPGDVALGAGHLPAAHLQVGAVQPGAHERRARGGLRLGDLVLVVREDEVDAAGVDVEGLPEIAHRHRRALEVPPRAPGADRRLPAGLSLPGALPQDEVADVVLGVLVGGNPLPHPELVGIEARQPPVGGPAGDAEEDRAVVGPVGMTGREEALDERDHLGDVTGRPRELVRSRHPERPGVLQELADPAVGQDVDADPLGGRAPDDLVVDVGQVHHPGDPQAAPAQVAHQQVGEQERPEVAHVGRPVHRRPARVDPDVAGLQRLQRHEVAAERVVQADGHPDLPGSRPGVDDRHGPGADPPAGSFEAREVGRRGLHVDPCGGDADRSGDRRGHGLEAAGEARSRADDRQVDRDRAEAGRRGPAPTQAPAARGRRCRPASPARPGTGDRGRRGRRRRGARRTRRGAPRRRPSGRGGPAPRR